MNMMMKGTEMNLNEFEGVKGYATYAGALKKLQKEVYSEFVQCFVATTPKGRYVPVAVGQPALREGLHFRGIVVVG